MIAREKKREKKVLMNFRKSERRNSLIHSKYMCVSDYEK